SMHGGPFCGDYAGGWFMWAFRDAVADIGEYRTPQAAIEFYRSMATEINRACREGRLTCRYSPVAELPPIIPDNVANTFAALGGIVARISLVSPLPLTPQNSEGPSRMIHIAAVFLRVKIISPKAPSADDVVSRWQPGRLVEAAGGVQRVIRELFNFAWPAMVLAGGAAIVVSTIMSIGRRTVQPAMLIAWLLLLLIASRIALVALINGFLFRAINMEYTTPAAYCLVAAIVIGIYCLIVELRARHSSHTTGRLSAAAKADRCISRLLRSIQGTRPVRTELAARGARAGGTQMSALRNCARTPSLPHARSKAKHRVD